LQIGLHVCVAIDHEHWSLDWQLDAETIIAQLRSQRLSAVLYVHSIESALHAVTLVW